MRKTTFHFDGLHWIAKINLEGRALAVSVNGEIDDKELVSRLGPIALKFSDFWKSNNSRIVEGARRHLKRLGGSSIKKSSRCTVETADLGDSGWSLSSESSSSPIDFVLLLSFVDDDGPVYGEGAIVRVTGIIDDSLQVLRGSLGFELDTIT